MKRSESTPRSQVRAALRKLWLRSRERAAALKRDEYTCTICGAKQSRAKGKEVYVEVHHELGVKWNTLMKEIYYHLLVPPSDLVTLCKDCHKKEADIPTMYFPTPDFWQMKKNREANHE